MEQGILFNLLINDVKHENNKKNEKISQAELAAQLKSKMKCINFWVVGRRRLHRERNSKSSKWINNGDFFICFHDSVEDILLELAFDLAFAKLAI